MKAIDLERIINGINKKYLDELCGPLQDGNEGAEKVASRQVPPGGKPICGNGGCFGGIASSPCFCGITKGGYHNGSELENVIILGKTSGSQGAKVAVVATIDDATKKSDEDLPVVLAVGINYGQGDKYLKGGVGLWDKTMMRGKLDRAIKVIADETRKPCVHPSFPKPERYHLVATNFFPWITHKSWRACKFNSIEEMLLIYCHGFSDPFAHIEKICQKVQEEPAKEEKKMAGLVFHGADNAVPLLGAEFLRTRTASEWQETRPDIIFCDNLARSGAPIRNAVRLCGRRLGRPDVPDTFEE